MWRTTKQAPAKGREPLRGAKDVVGGVAATTLERARRLVQLTTPDVHAPHSASAEDPGVGGMSADARRRGSRFLRELVRLPLGGLFAEQLAARPAELKDPRARQGRAVYRSRAPRGAPSNQAFTKPLQKSSTKYEH